MRFPRDPIRIRFTDTMTMTVSKIFFIAFTETKPETFTIRSFSWKITVGPKVESNLGSRPRLILTAQFAISLHRKNDVS